VGTTSKKDPRRGRRHGRLAVACLLIAGCAASPVPPQEPPGEAPQWSQFRGPGGLGVAAGSYHWPVAFGPERHRQWATEIGAGHSSPCIVGDRIFLTCADEGTLTTLCIDRTTGAILWERPVEVDALERIHEINSVASPTPTADEERVYVVFGSYGLLCYDHAGTLLWEQRLPVADNLFGTASSLVLAGAVLIHCNDNREQSYLEALELATGERRWRTERPGFGSGWSTPMIWKHNGVDEVVVYGVWWLTGYALATGEQRWSIPGLADEPCITPVHGEGLVFVTSYNMKTNPEVIGLPTFAEILTECDVSGDGQLDAEEVRTNRSVLSRADADGEGDHPLRIFFRFLDGDENGRITQSEWGKLVAWVDGFEQANGLIAVRPPASAADSAEIAWKEPRGVPECPSPLYHDGRVYLIKNGGLVSCLEAATGARRYLERLEAGGPYYASPVVANDRIYVASARGVITVFAAGDTLEVLASNDLGERILSTPALVEGCIYVRTEHHLLSFRLPAAAG
jgi:outer membrane protein assembly factor BamB